MTVCLSVANSAIPVEYDVTVDDGSTAESMYSLRHCCIYTWNIGRRGVVEIANAILQVEPTLVHFCSE